LVPTGTREEKIAATSRRLYGSEIVYADLPTAPAMPTKAPLH
jgi:hypothetical protein